MQKQGVSLEIPPNSTHFDSAKCLKPPKDENSNESAPAAVPAMMVTATAATPKPMEYSYPPPPPWMYHYSMPPFPMPMPPAPYYPYSTAASPNLPSGSLYAGLPKSPAMPSPGKALGLNVSLDQFCLLYKIDTSDQEKLGLLGYRPGDNNILKLEPEDWKEVTFTKLRWMSFLDAHRQFLHDVKSGQWDYLTNSL
jgi:hypothetical protein